MRLRLLLPGCCVLIGTGYGADWRMYLADSAHSSYQPTELTIQSQNVSQLQALWKISFGSTIASGVTVADGVAYVGDWNGNFYALDAASGQARWSQFLGKAPAPADSGCMPSIGISAQAAVVGERVYIAGGDSAVYALDRATGQILWRTPLADPQDGSYLWSSLTVSQNAIYIGIASLADCPLVRGGLARIPLDDPDHPLIRYLMPPNTQGSSIWSTAAVDEAGGLVYVTTGNAAGQDAEHGVWGSALLALDAATLEIRSFFFLPVTEDEGDADWGSSPLLFESGGDSLIAANGKNGVMYVLRRPTLELLWKYTLAIDCDSPGVGCGSISTPAYDGSVLYSGAGQPLEEGAPLGSVYAFDPLGRNLLWRYSAPAAVLAPVTVVPGLVFAATLRGLAALDSATGTELWNDGMTMGLFGQPVVANGIVYATYVNGDVIAWSLPVASASQVQ